MTMLQATTTEKPRWAMEMGGAETWYHNDPEALVELALHMYADCDYIPPMVRETDAIEYCAECMAEVPLPGLVFADPDASFTAMARPGQRHPALPDLCVCLSCAHDIGVLP